MKRVIDIVSHFSACKTITLPLSPFMIPSDIGVSATWYTRMWDRLLNKLLHWDELVCSAQLRLALEIVPGSLLGGTEGLMRLIKETGHTTIGYNLDTGHVYSSKECIVATTAKLTGRIYGTHLKDNFGTENLALPPGAGSIPWKAVLDTLQVNGYTGSYDLEIACDDPAQVLDAYKTGKQTLVQIFEKQEEA